MLVEADTPLPTPWDKTRFEASSNTAQAERRKLRAAGAPETEMDRLFTEQMDRETALLASMTHAGRVGAFEGASYEPIGLYRSEVDCIMFTRKPGGVLPGLPARDQPGDRSAFATVGDPDS